MNLRQKILFSVINFSRRTFRNTWVHRIPATSWLYKKITHATFNKDYQEIIFRNYKYKLPTKDTAVVPSMMSGDYEKLELDIFSKLLNKGDTVLDIGANVGVYSIEASKIIGQNGQIFAFEPIKENISLIEQNLKINGINNIRVMPNAISDRDRKVRIYKVKDSISTHTVGQISTEFEQVDALSIDSFVKENQLKVDIIKMDIEGNEGFAIEGAEHTLKTQQPILFTEFSAHHLKQCRYNPQKHAHNLLGYYKYCYLIDENKGRLEHIKSEEKLARLFNGNIILSAKPIKTLD